MTSHDERRRTRIPRAWSENTRSPDPGHSRNVCAVVRFGSERAARKPSTPPGSALIASPLFGLSAIPLLLAAATLVSAGLGPESSGWWWRVAALLCLVALPVALALTARGRGASTLAARLVAAPALLAPLAVCFPWTVAPDHLGLGFGEFGFFLHWLTKYPSQGPINVEVLLGILCVLGCAFLPWLTAALALSHRGSRITRAVLLGLALIPYVPVLIRLDLLLFAAGIVMKSTSFQPVPPIWAAFGAMLRLTAILSMIGMLFELQPGVDAMAARHR
jgi:hypothetical protein